MEQSDGGRRPLIIKDLRRLVLLQHQKALSVYIPCSNNLIAQILHHVRGTLIVKRKVNLNRIELS